MPAMLFRNLLVALLLLVPALPAFAQEQPPAPGQWQAGISTQGQAICASDAPAAICLSVARIQTCVSTTMAYFSTIDISGQSSIIT